MSISAKPQRIIIVAFEGVQLLDLAGPSDVFSAANAFAPKSYEVLFAGSDDDIAAANGLKLRLDGLPKVKPSDTILVTGGPEKMVNNALANQTLMTWLQTSAKTVNRMASVCSGAFILGELGLLNGKRAVTHWSATKRLAQLVGNAQIEEEAIFVEDGKIWTSAGVTTGIDMALAMVARDLGDQIALKVARSLVVHLMRSGNQSQFSEPLTLQLHAGPDLARLIPWLEKQIGKPTSVQDMAQEMGLSERQFHRKCVAQFSLTPAKLLLELRLDRARHLLRDKSVRISTLHTQCGFESAAALSKAFKKQFAISPKTYRDHWVQQQTA